MADKNSTIILKVDLECRRCYKKISKAICQVQERVNIQEIVFNEKTNTVTISGPFDPKKVCKKLCSKACSVIKEIEIKDTKGKPKDSPKPAEPKKDKPKDDAKVAEPAKPAKAAEPAKLAEPAKDKPKEAKLAEPAKDKPKEAKQAEPAKDKPKEAKQAEPAKDKPKEAKPVESAEPKKDEPKDDKDKPKDAKPKEVKFNVPEGGKDAQKALEWVRSEPIYFDHPVQGFEPVWAKPACGCQGYYGNSMCGGCAGGGYGSAGGYGWGQPGPIQVVYGKPVYDGYGSGSHNYFCEEDPQSCSIM